MPAIDVMRHPRPRRKLQCLSMATLCVGRSVALMSAMPSSCRGHRKREGVSLFTAKSRVGLHISGRGTVPLARPLHAAGGMSGSAACQEDDFEGGLEEDDFDEDLEEEDFSAALVKGSGEATADVRAEEYFGRFISEAMKEEEARPNTKQKKASNPPVTITILDETQRMMKQQQQQIDLLMKLVQGRQQLPSPSANEVPASMDTFAVPQRTEQSSINVAPLKAMLFIDGTWLYYSLHGHNSGRDAVTSKFGLGWQNNYKVDWLALPRLICDQIQLQQRNSKTTFSGSDRPLEIARVIVFTSAKVNTDPNSRRMRMFRDMAHANYDVHMMQTTGQGEKCVDIQLAVEMLHYSTVPHALDVAILLSGDKDFVPALVRTRQKGKQVCVSSMRGGCNRVLYESPHIRDYDVVWLENCMDDLIVPIPPEERRDRAGMVSAFTTMRIVRDFVIAAPDHEWISSRDIGKYLKSVKISDSNILDELKAAQGGLRTFVMERACNLFDVKFPESGAIPGRGEFSFWVRVKGDSDGDDTLISEFKQTQSFTKEEQEFLEEYTGEKLISNLIKEDSYQHTEMAAEYFDSGGSIVELDGNATSDLDGSASPALGYSQLTVVKLKDICREKGLPLSGTKSALIDRLELDQRTEFEVPEKQRREKREASKTRTQLSHRGTKKLHRRWTSTISRGTGTQPMSTASNSILAGNIYSQALPQMDAASIPRNPRVGYAPLDLTVTAHVEALIKEYLKASGGTAGSRDVGRYLAANRGSRQGSRSALAELKETYSSLSAFVLSREDAFSVPANCGQKDFPVKLL